MVNAQNTQLTHTQGSVLDAVQILLGTLGPSGPPGLHVSSPLLAEQVVGNADQTYATFDGCRPGNGIQPDGDELVSERPLVEHQVDEPLVVLTWSLALQGALAKAAFE